MVNNSGTAANGCCFVPMLNSFSKRTQENVQWLAYIVLYLTENPKSILEIMGKLAACVLPVSKVNIRYLIFNERQTVSQQRDILGLDPFWSCIDNCASLGQRLRSSQSAGRLSVRLSNGTAKLIYLVSVCRWLEHTASELVGAFSQRI